MPDKPIHTIKEWYKKSAEHPLILGRDILRDWGRDELILKAEIARLEAVIKDMCAFTMKQSEEIMELKGVPPK